MLMSTLGLGFLIGMQHATEVDHVAAVSSIASRKSGIRAISRHGLFWGIGHTLHSAAGWRDLSCPAHVCAGRHCQQNLNLPSA